MDDMNISHDEFIEITKNYSRAAEVAKLIYVSDKEQGIVRIKKGTGFSYQFKDAVLKDKKQLKRIQQLVLPPAWTNVWICYYCNGHLQATGYDSKNSKQYSYHAL